MKKITLLLLCCLLMTTACNRNTENISSNDIDENAATLIKNVSMNILNYIEKCDNESEILYKTYDIKSGKLSTFDYNNTNEINYFVVDDFDVNSSINGMVTKYSDGKIYLSIRDDNNCAIKKLNEDNIKIYSLKEEEKCHEAVTEFGDELYINVMAYDSNSLIYDSSTVTNKNIGLYSYNNLLDKKSCNYQWYRNNEKINGATNEFYHVITNYEDANYYVEITTFDGQIIKSSTINVVIQK